MPPMSLRTLSSEAYSAGFGLHAFNGHGAGTAGQRIRQASKAPALSSDADGSGSPRPQLKNRPPLLPLAASPGIPKTAQDGAKLKFDANNKKPIKIELMTYFDGTMKRGCNDKGQDPKKNDDIRAPHPSTKEKINDAVVPSMPASIKQQSKVDASSKKVSQASAGLKPGKIKQLRGVSKHVPDADGFSAHKLSVAMGFAIRCT